jgi:hypothetical protein
MFNRVDVPNEEDCPVALDTLASLMRIPEAGARQTIADLAPAKRVEFALFCYRRAHLRQLALTIASQCTKFELEHIGGQAGAALYRASHASAPPDTHEGGGRSVSLAGPYRKAG